jgi:hypothetical protein
MNPAMMGNRSRKGNFKGGWLGFDQGGSRGVDVKATLQ